MKPDLFWIPGPWRGNLAVVPRPRGGDWLEDEARAWQQAGIGVIVSLLETDEAAGLDLAKEPDAAKSNKYSLHFIPDPRSWCSSFARERALVPGGHREHS